MQRNLVSQEETNVTVKDAILNINRLVSFEPVDIKAQAQALGAQLESLISKDRI